MWRSNGNSSVFEARGSGPVFAGADNPAVLAAIAFCCGCPATCAVMVRPTRRRSIVIPPAIPAAATPSTVWVDMVSVLISNVPVQNFRMIAAKVPRKAMPTAMKITVVDSAGPPLESGAPARPSRPQRTRHTRGHTRQTPGVYRGAGSLFDGSRSRSIISGRSVSQRRSISATHGRPWAAARSAVLTGE